MPETDLARRLPVYATELVGPSSPTLPAPPGVGGRYDVDDDAVCFLPKYPFLAGTSYTVLVHHSVDRDDGVITFELEDFEPVTILRPLASSEPTTRVVEIYPTAASLPRNHLRFYVHFSNPMSEGFVDAHVHVVRADTGEPLVAAFLPMEHELWDPERRRVTILFDPARIKRGLAPHEEAGYALREGVPVALVVADDFVDADGRQLASGSSRRYDVSGDVHKRVDPNEWELASPAGGTLRPLVVRFDRPLDHALLHRCLAVVDGNDRRVAGRVSVPAGEGSWAFTPTTPWPRAGLRLIVDTTLEDLAGNSVARVFDRDLSDADHAPIAVGEWISVAIGS
ncbi:MAG: hypothetical protein WD271_00860 [Acidimicrobiia bacterium]